MKKEDIIRKNMDLLNEFMKYAFDHPEILDQIPAGGEVVILPLDDPNVMRENKKIAEMQRKAGKEVALITFRRPKPVTPALELMSE
jgi:hypothetical protein